MSFWKKLYEGGNNLPDPIGDYFRSEPLRNLGDGGKAIDDFWKRLTGQESYYNRKAREENEEFWKDYTDNTGVEPRYPIRTGAEWNAAIQTMPMVSQIPGKHRAIDMLYGGQI